MRKSVVFLIAALALLVGVGAAVSANQNGPDNRGHQEPDSDPRAIGVSKVATPGNPVTIPARGERPAITVSCTSGSVNVNCGNPTRVTPRPGTTWRLGDSNTIAYDLSDIDVTVGDRSSGDVFGQNCDVTFAGERSSVNTHGDGGGSVTTRPGSENNSGDISGTGVSFRLGGQRNCFNYQGAQICSS